ncbi:MAG: hypothetical protein BGO26_17965 [Actinobacteria bacterium 69-20]|jgi:hypothetical protein|nr:MAG: hypothetical protein BGO26_17965 [Actinobacteria bacterium 69-20]
MRWKRWIRLTCRLPGLVNAMICPARRLDGSTGEVSTTSPGRMCGAMDPLITMCADQPKQAGTTDQTTSSSTVARIVRATVPTSSTAQPARSGWLSQPDRAGPGVVSSVIVIPVDRGVGYEPI